MEKDKVYDYYQILDFTLVPIGSPWTFIKDLK